MSSTETKQASSEVIEALQLTQAKQYEEAAQVLEQGLEAGAEDPEEQALLYSTLGMVQKKMGQIEQAHKSYLSAEKCSPEDPVLKIIVTRFLLNETREYDIAIKKAKQILNVAKEVPSLSHQAYTMMGLAYLRKGKVNKASEMLDKAMSESFEGMATSENVDFNLVEAMLREKQDINKCKDFIQAAYNLARNKKEYTNMTAFRQILDSFETTNV